MKKIELQTDFDCLVVAENEQTYMSTTDIITLEKDTFFVYPVHSKKVLPFAVNLSNRVGRNYRIVELDEKICCFMFSTSHLSRKNVEKIKVGKETVEVLISKTSFEAKCSHYISYEFDFPPKSYKTMSWQNFLLLHFFFESEENMFVFNINTGEGKIFCGKDFVVNNGEITFVETIKDFAKTRQNKKVILENDKIKENTTPLSQEKFLIKPETVCFCFLECIKNKNFSLAKKLLSPSLQGIEEEKIEEYFGNLYKFFPLSYSRFSLIYPNDTKLIAFSLDQNLIADFEFEEQK